MAPERQDLPVGRTDRVSGLAHDAREAVPAGEVQGVPGGRSQDDLPDVLAGEVLGAGGQDDVEPGTEQVTVDMTAVGEQQDVRERRVGRPPGPAERDQVDLAALEGTHFPRRQPERVASLLDHPREAVAVSQLGGVRDATTAEHDAPDGFP